MPPARSSSGSCFHHSPPKCGGSIPDDEPDLDWFNQERDATGAEPECFDQRVRRSLLDRHSFSEGGGEGVSQVWKPEEIPLGDGRILVLDDT